MTNPRKNKQSPNVELQPSNPHPLTANRQPPTLNGNALDRRPCTANYELSTVNALIDTHAHLDFPELVSEVDPAIERAAAAGVTRIIAIGTTGAAIRQAVQIAAQHPSVIGTLGVHPTHAAEVSENFIAELR